MSTGTLPPPMVPAVPARTAQRMSEAEFLALPDDGIERWLIDGEVREFGQITRNFFHGHTTIRVGKYLDNWLDTRPEPRGAIIGGNAKACLTAGRIVGLDVAYVSAAMRVTAECDRKIVESIPTLAVIIPSPSNTRTDHREIANLPERQHPVDLENGPRRQNCHRVSTRSATRIVQPIARTLGRSGTARFSRPCRRSLRKVSS